MKKTLLLSLLVLLAACSKDDDSPDVQPSEKSQTTAPMQVAIVFAPGQLGAMCTNDNLLTDVEEMANTHKDLLASTFICMKSYEETRQAVKDWAAMAYGADSRQHRLLILTDPVLMKVMEGVQWQESDHVLLLKTWLDEAKKVGPAGRTHVLNISFAKAVKQAVEHRRNSYMTEYADRMGSFNKIEDGPYNVYRLNEDVHYADSIIETLREMVPESTWFYNIGESALIEEGEYEDLYGISEEVYIHAYAIWTEPLFEEDELCMPVQFIDYGVFNRSYEWYWTSHPDSPWKPQCFLIGEHGNSREQLDYITPKYDLKSWITRWMAHPDDMPEEEWSGSAVLDVWEQSN